MQQSNSNDTSLVRIIRGAMADAHAAGLDSLSQTRHAVAAVLSVRPDLNATDARWMVERAWPH